MTANLPAIGKLLHRLRVLSGKTLEEVAEALGCPVSYLSLMESSKRNPSVNLFFKAINAIGIPVGIYFEPDKRITFDINAEFQQDMTLETSNGNQ